MSNFPINFIVLHYSATYPDQDLGVSDLRKMHLDRGFSDVGYHYVVKRNGDIQKGRLDSAIGAHVKGHNTGSIGICCIGGVDRATGPNVGVDNRTKWQIESTIKLINELLLKYPNAQVVGRKDLGTTQCPGFDVRDWWAEVNRNKAKPAFSGSRFLTDLIKGFVSMFKGK